MKEKRRKKKRRRYTYPVSSLKGNSPGKPGRVLTTHCEIAVTERSRRSSKFKHTELLALEAINKLRYFLL
jgi:hypothetical protein